MTSRSDGRHGECPAQFPPPRSDLPVLTTPWNHAPSAARYLQECLDRSEYWDVPVEKQTDETAPQRVLAFLQSSDSPRSSAAI